MFKDLQILFIQIRGFWIINIYFKIEKSHVHIIKSHSHDQSAAAENRNWITISLYIWNLWHEI